MKAWVRVAAVIAAILLLAARLARGRKTSLCFTGKILFCRETSWPPRQFVAASNAPVYAIFDTFMGCGVVGGSLSQVEASARQAATLALRILHGEDIAHLPVQPGPPNLIVCTLPNWSTSAWRPRSETFAGRSRNLMVLRSIFREMQPRAASPRMFRFASIGWLRKR